MAFAFEGQGGLDSFFSNSLLPSGSWGDMDDDDDGEFNSFNFPAVAVLPKPALKRHSSHTNLQLFNEGVFQVPKFDSPQGQSRESFDGSSSPPRDATTPRRDACNTPDSGSGGSDVASFMPFSPSRFGVCVRARRAANANLTVRDALLGQELRLEVNPKHNPYTLHPTPNTQHPTPNTQHPTPNTQHPTPNTLHYTLHPTTYTTPYTLHPTHPYTLHPTP
ncbi:hypothetical protein T484DRAFT_2254187 [Baffinella frigidus]|nr:hypothetical protein T484DRAFT_2254187 [Cryptophyta sp. CCMP2293]